MSEAYLALILSDLHLGEEDCVMMDQRNGEAVFDKQIAIRVRDIIHSKINQKQVKYLILAGDILELSLATRQEAFRSLKSFLEEFCDIGESLIFIPGNHDHHLWVGFQEEARIFSQIRDAEDVKPYYHAFIPKIGVDKIDLPTSEEISKPYGKKTFLYELLPEKVQTDKEKNFIVAYPNLYLDLAKKILVTHGHFFEDVWRLFSDAFPDSLELSQPSYKSMEQINSPFIEFGWYHLGQAGKLSTLLEELWDEVHAGKHYKIKMVVDELGDYLDKRLEYGPTDEKGFKAFIYNAIGRHLKEFFSDKAIAFAMTTLKRLIISQLRSEKPQTSGASLRHATDIFSDPRKKSKIKDYLEIASNDDQFNPDTLVFGHTHVPILRTTPEEVDITIAGKPVLAYNTGGWVADVLEPSHLRQSRPIIIAITMSGAVEVIEIPWPSESMFEHIFETHHEETVRKTEIRSLIKKIIMA